MREELLLQNQENEALESWSGDPCLLFPWKKGIECDSSNGSSVITKLHLSSNNLKGAIPSSVTKMNILHILNLSHNHFDGYIPSFPPFSLLISVDLSYNDLMGQLPESIISLPLLKSLCFCCIQRMSDEEQAKLNNSLINRLWCKAKKKPKFGKVFVIGAITRGSVLITLAAVGIILVCCYRHKSIPLEGFGGTNYPMSEGGFDSVYRGTLESRRWSRSGSESPVGNINSGNPRIR